MVTRALSGWCQRAACAAVALSLCLAGCGGSKTLSRSELVTRANTACRHANAQVSALAPVSPGLPGVADYAHRLQPIAGRLVSQLNALDAPDSVRAPFRRYVAAMRAGVAKLPALGAAARRGDAQDVERLSAAIGSRPTDRLATQLGLSACAEHPAPRTG
jgi:hypothetical protein